MNQALQDVIEHRRTTNVFGQCGQLADYSALEGRLAPPADAGFMSPELVAGWVGALKVCTTINRRCSGMKRYEALHVRFQYCWLRLVEQQLPITRRKKAGAR